VIPTRNRPRHLKALLRFLRDNGMTGPAIVADSSDDEPAAAVREGVGSLAEVVRFPATVPVLEKMIAAVERVQTPYVVMMPDDDITFPHAIEASLSFLADNPDHVAAQGYVLDFGIDSETFDIRGARWFAPGIDGDGPVTRIYNLVGRYQPFLWAVFRRDAMIAALKAARDMPPIFFQEMTIMIAAVTQGKTARLPVIYTLRGIEESHDALPVVDPFYAFLSDSEAFFRNYAKYRANLVAVVQALGGRIDLVSELRYLDLPGGKAGLVTLEHALNLIHAIYYGLALDRGMVNYTVQRVTGVEQPPIPVPPIWSGSMALREGDSLHNVHERRYVWRKEVMKAEPKSEIAVSPDEVRRVEAALAHYALR
jgi:glycosyltransferase domain-containing protein